MTVSQLSARSVKVQLTADELQFFLHGETPPADSPQMLRLLAYMLMHAEAGSGIRFSELPVTVELIAGSDGGLTAYFTAQLSGSDKQKKHPSKTVRLAARFSDFTALSSCCKQLMPEQPHIISSSLHEYHAQWILSLKLHRNGASRAHHLLLEYGKPYRSSAINKARLLEYAKCLYETNAVEAVANASAAS